MFVSCEIFFSSPMDCRPVVEGTQNIALSPTYEESAGSWRLLDKPSFTRLQKGCPSLGQKDPTLRCLALLHYAFNMEFVD